MKNNRDNYQKLSKLFNIDGNFLKNCYYKIKRKLYQNDLEIIKEYVNKLTNGENFCRNFSIKKIILADKKVILHKAIIFFGDFDIIRLMSSQHLLIDGTFKYPTGFMKTVVIKYFDKIVEKIAPRIFIIINNKIQEEYIDIF